MGYLSNSPHFPLHRSFNKEITSDGMDAFSQALLKASTPGGYPSTRLGHLTLTKEAGEEDPGDHWKLAQIMKLTVNEEASFELPLNSDRGHISEYRTG